MRVPLRTWTENNDGCHRVFDEERNSLAAARTRFLHVEHSRRIVAPSSLGALLLTLVISISDHSSRPGALSGYGSACAIKQRPHNRAVASSSFHAVASTSLLALVNKQALGSIPVGDLDRVHQLRRTREKRLTVPPRRTKFTRGASSCVCVCVCVGEIKKRLQLYDTVELFRFNWGSGGVTKGNENLKVSTRVR